jgi:outer membrane receptor protein involved in Fe transport
MSYRSTPARLRASLSLALVAAASSSAHDPVDRPFELSPLEVSAKSTSLIGVSVSASQGVVGQVDLATRPILRPGEVLETIPGLIATQHSGTGKANQYFLRGFNLDHGTDFSVHLDGMPVNLRTHGHGQGYLDINFLIPETIQRIEFRKGSYYADVGDFSSAGSVRLQTYTQLPADFAQLTLGEDQYYRLVIGQTVDLGEGHLTYALEGQSYEGPWEIGEDLEKLSGYAAYSWRSENWTQVVRMMAYDATWDSADQIPRRAVESGLITDLGSIDDDVGGDTSRYSLSYESELQSDFGLTRLNLYAIDYELNLWSNFTYFLEDPVNGDEFEQLDDRRIYGANLEHLLETPFGDRRMTHRFGAQWRWDEIGEVGLFKTANRERLATVRRDSVNEWSTGFYYENTIAWTDRLRTVAGLRWDYYDFSVDSNLSPNSGDNSADITSPKLSVIYAINPSLEWFASAGTGFHSNDARGTTITVDPGDPSSPARPVDALVRSDGAETGVRLSWGSRYTSSITVWWLELDSELLFVGDAGLTEPSRPSERYGVEWTNTLQLTDTLLLDWEVSLSEARFTDEDPVGDAIPGAIDTVIQVGVLWQPTEAFYGSFRARHFGKRPLVEDESVESPDTTIFNLRLGYKLGESWELMFDLLNVFDSNDHDITYYYESRLAGEPTGGVEDIHYHVIEPRTARLTARYLF